MSYWFDLSPMRPDEYMRQDAQRWNEAVILRNAINEGIADAQGDQHAKAQLANEQFPDDPDD